MSSSSPSPPDVPDRVLGTIERACRDCYPQEVCGFWVRSVGAGEQPDEFRRVPNLATEPGAFWCHEATTSGILADIERRRQQVVAFLHTHESGHGPSTCDGHGAAATDYPWLVLSRAEDGWKVTPVTPRPAR